MSWKNLNFKKKYRVLFAINYFVDVTQTASSARQIAQAGTQQQQRQRQRQPFYLANKRS